MKKKVFVFIVLSIIASVFTGCQTNTEGENSNETTSLDNNGYVTSTGEPII